MNPAEKRLSDATIEFSTRQAHFLNDKDAEAFAPAVLAFRTELDIAANDGVEHWQSWHLVSPWITEPEDRLYCLRRVLANLQAGHARPVAPDRPRMISTHNFLRAQTLVQMAEIHLQQSRRDEARECYERALPFARTASDVHGDAVVAGSGLGSIEGKIAAALLTLDANET